MNTNSKGYKILSAVPRSPYDYAPTRRKQFDVEVAKELTKKYSSESVQKVIQDLSPLGRENKNYGRDVLHEVRGYGR